MRDRGIGFVIGALLGAAAGLLMAPRSGMETRARIRDVGREAADLATGPFQTVAQDVTAAIRRRQEVSRGPGPCAPTL